MKKQFFNLVSALTVTSLAIFNTGCKEDTIIKANIAPVADDIYSNVIGDTLTLITKTVIDDSIVTSFSSSSTPVIHGLGTVNDPLFGRSNWGIYTQFLPTANNLSIPTPDSVVLILPYYGVSWGDTLSSSAPSMQSFTVYRVTETMSKDSTYYSKSYKNIDWNNPVSDPTPVNVLGLKYDTLKIAGAVRSPHLRIKLKASFAAELVAAAASSNNSADFLDKIKGIYIGPSDTSNGSLRTVPYFFLNGNSDYNRASIALYYSENGNTKPDSIKTAFLNFVYTDCAHFNRITRNYTGSWANNYIQSTAVSDSIILVQNEPGASLDIRIPYIKNLPNAIINKAQLVITQIKMNDESDKFTAPSRLYPVGVDATGAAYTIKDREPVESSGPLDFIDGTRRDVTLPDGTQASQYYINIPREVQKAILNKADELHLRINGTVTYPGAYRLIAGGKKHSNSMYRIRLNISYSKIN